MSGVLRSIVGRRANICLSLGGFFQLARKFLDALTHYLASFKFYRRSGRNHKTAPRLIWISANARFCQPWLKNAEIPQFNWNVVGQTVGNFIKRPLDYIEDLMLNHAGLVTDGDNDVAFG
jgi:hypothetical protein